jgi:hypothetical protein
MTGQIRKEILWFSKQMEVKLKENDNKGGWVDCSPLWLLKRLKEEVEELEKSMLEDDNLNTIREASDVANFAMMISDIEAKRKGEL